MRTYNVIHTSGELLNVTPVTRKEANIIVKNVSGRAEIVPSTVKPAPKKWYYRGDEVTIIEDRQNGWTLVNNVDGMYPFRYAVTTELVSK